MSGEPTNKAADYLNPVYPHSFPDPFVLKHGNDYFAYCTGLHADGGVFPVLRSNDLVHWSEVGAAMTRLATDAPFYWAPEVIYADGQFLLYYSVGNETLMELRVAVSDRPDGRFVDAGKRLTAEEFAIDAHVFTDEDGKRYMFYATDFLEHTHIGTGTVVDRMLDAYTLEGKPRPVTRAKYDWQVYDPQRKEKGGVRWHTVEGPTVLKRKGVYFEMFSGGNWQNTTYGVSFAVTDDLANPHEWTQFSDGDALLPILRTIPGLIIGPGHNSVVRGPNELELYCVYHRWTDVGRVLAIDRMDIVHRRIFVLGATNTPQPAPFRPSVRDFLSGWESEGGWELSADSARSAGPGSLTREVPNGFICVFTVESGAPFFAGIRHNGGQLTFNVDETEFLAADAAFELSASPHQIRLEVDGHWINIIVDGWHTVYERKQTGLTTRLCLAANTADLTFSGLTCTEGFEDLFDRGAEAEWIAGEGLDPIPADGELKIIGDATGGTLRRSQVFTDLDFAVNLRVAAADPDGFACGPILFSPTGDEALTVSVGERLELVIAGFIYEYPFPPGWDVRDYHQYRVLVRDGHAVLYLEANEMGVVPFAMRALSPGVFVRSGTVTVEMARAMLI